MPVRHVGIDSQAKYAALAVGAAHVYPRRPSRSFGPGFCWDHAPGALLVEECGGLVTDLDGAPLDWTRGERLSANRGIFAAARRDLHDRLLPFFRLPE